MADNDLDSDSGALHGEYQDVTDEEIRERRKKFIAALRSGEYKQGQGALYSHLVIESEGNVFCCVGVGCMVGNWEPIVRSVEDRQVYRYDESRGYDFFSAYYKTEEVSRGVSLVETLVEMNDGHEEDDNDTGKTFSDIADFLERYWNLVS
jgi:hypothetical protein